MKLACSSLSELVLENKLIYYTNFWVFWFLSKMCSGIYPKSMFWCFEGSKTFPKWFWTFQKIIKIQPRKTSKKQCLKIMILMVFGLKNGPKISPFVSWKQNRIDFFAPKKTWKNRHLPHQTPLFQLLKKCEFPYFCVFEKKPKNEKWALAWYGFNF